MQTFARVADGIVAELIEIEDGGPALADRFHPDLVAQMRPVPAGQAVAQGWTWDGEAFAPPLPVVAPVVVPARVTRRQMLLALTAGGVISAEEALAAATTGAVPSAIDAVFAALPAADALAARITWATMSEVERAHPLIGAMIAAKVVSAEQADALFIAAAAL